MNPKCIPASLVQAKTGAKALTECSDDEIKKLLESWTGQRKWDWLFQAFFEMPLRHGLPALDILGKSDWEPEAPDLKRMLRQMLADSPGQRIPATLKQRTIVSRVLDFCPAKATAAEVESLLAALGTPRTGWLRSARKLVRTMVGCRDEPLGQPGQIVVERDEFALADDGDADRLEETHEGKTSRL